MPLAAAPKRPDTLIPTPILQQTAFWSRVKARTGWIPQAFDLLADDAGILDASDPPDPTEPLGDVLVIRRSAGPDTEIGCAPFGPEILPAVVTRGPWLEEVSESLREHLPESCVFVRYDLPWESPYALEKDRYDSRGDWLGSPDTPIRELRMNWDTEKGLLRKAPTDWLPPDTVLVDITSDEDEILSRMRPKTRYNIRLAERRGVRVRIGTSDDLAEWYLLYLETAERNGIARHDFRHFASVFADTSEGAGGVDRPQLLLAERDGSLLAGLILTIAGNRATYLYGASGKEGRETMAAYALQMEAIRRARTAGCVTYDMFGVSPRPDPGHPLFG